MFKKLKMVFGLILWLVLIVLCFPFWFLYLKWFKKHYNIKSLVDGVCITMNQLKGL